MTQQAPGPTADKLLTAAEAATQMRVSLTTVYRLTRSETLRSHRSGQGKVRPRGLRIWESSVDAYLNDTPNTPTEVA